MTAQLRFKILDPDTAPPARAHPHDGGVDLASTSTVSIDPGDVVTVRTGVAAAIPAGWVGFLAVRSSMTRRGLQLSNQIGIIDADYRGEILAPILNRSATVQTVEAGARIVQLVVVPCLTGPVAIVNDLDDTGRGSGGFGSTGP